MDDEEWCDPEFWLQHIPRPHLLDVLVQVLVRMNDDNDDSEEGANLPTRVLEELLPELCFSLPYYAQGCVALLNALPQKSVVWDKLEEGLDKQKHLPVEVTVSLYNARPSALESEMIRVLHLYTKQPVTSDYHNWQERSCFTISQFSSARETVGGGDGSGAPGSNHVSSLKSTNSSTSVSDSHALNVSQNINSSQTVKFSQKNGSLGNRMNHWVESPVIQASVQCSTVFSICLSMLFKILRGKHSISAVFASSDYFSRIFGIIGYDLFTLFPPHLQHLVYILTLPLVSGAGNEYFQNKKNVSIVEQTLTDSLTGETGIDEVKSLLCFFPFWLPVLDRRKFLDKYLIDWWCES